MNLQVWGGAIKYVFSKFSVLMLLPQDPHSGALSLSLSPFQRGGFRVVISEGGQARTRQKKAPVFGVQAFLRDPGWSAVGSAGWAWMGPFKPEEQESGELWGCHWRGACAVDPGVWQDCWSPEGGHLVEVLTGLAAVSSRTCRLPAAQTDAEVATARSSQGSSQPYSVWSFLFEPSQCPSSFKMGEEIQHRNREKHMNYESLIPVRN